VLLTDTTLLGALVVLWHLRRPNLDVLAVFLFFATRSLVAKLLVAKKEENRSPDY